MARIPINATDGVPPQPVETSDYLITCIQADGDFESNKGNKMLKLLCKIDGEENAPPMSFFAFYWSDDSEDWQINQSKLALENTLECFGVPFDDQGFDDADFVGLSTRAAIELCEPDEFRDTPYNKITKLYKS